MGDSKMNENQGKQDNLLDTTDCLEAVGVFRGWKNFLFIIAACCLLVLQTSFWVVNLELVKIDNETAAPTKAGSPSVTDMDTQPVESAKTIRIETSDDVNRIQKAAEQVAAEPNLPAAPPPKKAGLLGAIKFKHLAWLIRLAGFVLIPTAMLYCLTMLFCLKLSLLGRLGGINHISRAFLISLLMFVLIFPWQRFFFFADIFAGAMYTPAELLTWVKWYAAHDQRIFAAVAYYFRFTGYWLLVMLLLIFSMLRSIRWAKATLRRLEII